MATNSARQATLTARLTLIESAIAATLSRNAASYSTEVQSLASLGLSELRKMEQDTLNELRRLERGTRFGGIKFVGVSS